MNNKLVANENITKTPPDWQHPVLPGNFVQGQLIMTVNSGAEPPLDPSNFKYVLTEKLSEIFKTRLDYNPETNLYILYQGHGHLNNDDNVVYNWEEVGRFEGLTEEVAEELKNLVYVAYRYDTTTPNTLKVYGVNKAGTEILLCDINFVSAQVLEQAIQNLSDEVEQQIANLSDTIEDEIERSTTEDNNLNERISTERNRAILRENQLEELIENAGVVEGVANEIVENQQEQKQINVRVDNDSIKVNSDNQLYADIIDDTRTSTTKTYSSFEINRLMDGDVKYKGDVQTYEDLPLVKEVGDIYYVADTGNSYIWNGEIWRDFEENYFHGQGININDRIISAKIDQGLEFDNQNNIKAKINKGLEFDDSGNTNAKIGQGLEFGITNEIKAKVGNGIDLLNGAIVAKAQNSKGIVVDANGIGTKIDSSLMFDSNGQIGTKDKLTFTNGIKDTPTETQGQPTQHQIILNTNFNLKDYPLEEADSKISLYSDGKIGVDTENVVLSGDLLTTIQVPQGRNYVVNGTIPNMNKYDMLYIVVRNLYGEYVQRPATTSIVRTTTILPGNIGNPGDTPTGANAIMLLIRDLNPNTNTFSRLDRWYMSTWGTWQPANTSATTPINIDIYGMRAR